jgi:hypothetical protein
MILFLIGCGSTVSSNDFISSNHNITSPSGEYIAVQENDVNTNSYYIYIFDKTMENSYLCEVTFYHRFTNLILWAEEEDVLWAYNSDIGVFCWTHEDDSWVMYRSFGNRSMDGVFVNGLDESGESYQIDINDIPRRTLYVPQLLADTRPRVFQDETVTFYAIPNGYSLSN